LLRLRKGCGCGREKEDPIGTFAAGAILRCLLTRERKSLKNSF